MRNFLAFSLFLFAALGGEENLVIIGGGPAGLSAGIYAGRLELHPLIIEEVNPWNSLSFRVENYPGFPEGIYRFELLDNFRKQALNSGARVTFSKVIGVKLDKRPFEVELESGEVLLTKALIVACGTRPSLLGLESEHLLWGKGVCACAFCDGPFFEGKCVAVLGGDDKALQEACLLSQWASNVVVIGCMQASCKLLEQAYQRGNIHFIENVKVADICGISQDRVTGVLLEDATFVPCEGVFLALGRLPNTSLFSGKLDLDEKGYIKVESGSTITSCPGVFAAGDCADPRYSQIAFSTAAGCQAALQTYEYLLKKE